MLFFIHIIILFTLKKKHKICFLQILPLYIMEARFLLHFYNNFTIFVKKNINKKFLV